MPYRILAALLLLCALAPAQTTVLSDNLDQEPWFTEVAGTTLWLTAGFATNAQAYELASVTLDGGKSGGGTVLLELWTSTGAGVGQPGALVGTLTKATGPGMAQTWTGNGIALEPATHYWLVLRSLSATTDYFWRWTGLPIGDGVGFTHTWGITFDAGATWETYDQGPLMMRVLATPVGPWTDLGLATAGAAGDPVLIGSGDLTPGSVGSVALSGAAPSAPMLLFIAHESAPQPLKGGVLVPDTSGAMLAMLTDPAGGAALTWKRWPASLSGTAIYFQAAVLDAAAVQGVALSNALEATVP